MANEETMTIHETAPDGTETTIDITSTKPDDAANGDDQTFAEEIYEALFDGDPDDDDDDGNDDDTDDDDDDDGNTDTDDDTDDDADSDDDDTDSDDDEADDDADDGDDDPANQLTPTDAEISTNSTEFTIDQDMFPQTDAPVTGDPTDTGYAAAASDDPAAAPDTDSTTADADAAAQAAHADAAKDAQDAADQFVADGDYKAAADARETAENEAYAAGDNSMLGESSSGDLENAGYQQDKADDYREQQADHVAQGDYADAKEDAQNVASATGDADYLAGGSDHTAQADKDVGNLDWAAYDDKNADAARDNADYYAAQGDFDHAQTAADQADSYQASADDYGHQADPGSSDYAEQYDASSVVESGGAYDASAVDSGFDAGADMSAAAPAYDPGTDDVA